MSWNLSIVTLEDVGEVIREVILCVRGGGFDDGKGGGDSMRDTAAWDLEDGRDGAAIWKLF